MKWANRCVAVLVTVCLLVFIGLALIVFFSADTPEGQWGEVHAVEDFNGSTIVIGEVEVGLFAETLWFGGDIPPLGQTVCLRFYRLGNVQSVTEVDTDKCTD